MSGNVRLIKMHDDRLDINFTIPPYIQSALPEWGDPRKRRGRGAAARRSGPCCRAPGAHGTVGPVTRAPLSLPGLTAIFDYGEVISLTPSRADRAVIARLAGVSDGDGPFWAAYFAHRDALDQGTAGVAAYWRAIAADTGASWDEARMHELWAADVRSWLSINPATVDVLADLRAGGTPLALLSNAGADFASFLRHGPLGDLFSACYVSGELGLLKPHAEIYQHVLDDLGILPAEAIFIDNRASNVAGAEALGIAGHVFTDASRLRTFLESLASVPAAG
jgi:putative hydrolase of the HAD superfamily